MQNGSKNADMVINSIVIDSRYLFIEIDAIEGVRELISGRMYDGRPGRLIDATEMISLAAGVSAISGTHHAHLFSIFDICTDKRNVTPNWGGLTQLVIVIDFNCQIPFV